MRSGKMSECVSWVGADVESDAEEAGMNVPSSSLEKNSSY